jgi:hypothetical protein
MTEEASFPLKKIARLCFLVHSNLGVKVDSILVASNSDYARQHLALIQSSSQASEELLTLTLEYGLYLNQRALNSGRVLEKPAQNPTQSPNPPVKKDYKFGPRG